MMAASPLQSDVLQTAVDALEIHGSQAAAARALGWNRSTYRSRLMAAQLAGHIGIVDRQFEIPDLPDEELGIDDVMERRRRIYDQRQLAHDARRCIPIKIKTPGPIALVVFGDIHVDNPGSNFPLLEAHTELVRTTEGMFACAVGDLQDGWVGRLAHKWKDQGVTAKEAKKLVAWWVDTLADRLLFIVQGNHDAWTRGINGEGVLDWIASQANVVTENDGIRVSLELPSKHSIKVNCRHDQSGRSQFNPAHGVTKAALFGVKDDILLAGHTHEFGYNPLLNSETGRACHPIRVGSYKHIDEYARERGFPDKNLSECVTIVIDPNEPDSRHMTTVFFSPFQAARYLTLIRARS